VVGRRHIGPECRETRAVVGGGTREAALDACAWCPKHNTERRAHTKDKTR
jgi:hypothetical protein